MCQFVVDDEVVNDAAPQDGAGGRYPNDAVGHHSRYRLELFETDRDHPLGEIGRHRSAGSGIDQVVSLGVVTTSLSASRVGVSTKVSPTSCNAPPPPNSLRVGVPRCGARGRRG